jgi:hydroxylamine dehydrogenase
MMKQNKKILMIIFMLIISLALAACGGNNADEVDPLADLSPEAKACVECHATETTGIVADWDGTKHANDAISCIDCHEVAPDSPTALKNVEGHEDVIVAVSLLVSPVVCAECHEDAYAQFSVSGHHKAHIQRLPKEGLTTLVQTHEGRDHPEFGNAPDETGCMQCHGIEIQVDENGRPTADTFPSAGIGNVYPDNSIGNCTVCHSRHSFDIAEARKPEACGGCHIGPDHPDLEIFENTKHGQIFHTEGEEWKWDSPPGEWEPGDYRAPTCATCHMSGIGDLETTHNVSERLYWNLWAKVSKPRTSDDIMDLFYGDGEQGREMMQQVCGECHTSTHTEGYFASGDKAVQLYNEAYWKPAEEMRLDLAEKGLLKDNPWEDEFQIIHYYLWHHEGRRARQGSMMGAPDWAHWHGFFELQQDLYKLQLIYEQRIETGEIKN